MSTSEILTEINKWFDHKQNSEDEILSYELLDVKDNVVTFKCGEEELFLKFDDSCYFECLIYTGHDEYLMKLSDSMNCNEKTLLLDSLNYMSYLATIIYSDDNKNEINFDDVDVYEEEGYETSFNIEEKRSIDIAIVKKKWIDKDASIVSSMNKFTNERNDTLFQKCKTTQSIFSSGSSLKVLMNEMIELIKVSREEGIEIEAIDDNIHNWRIRFYRFSLISDLNMDLLNLYDKHGYNFIELELIFARDIFPFYPPLVSLVRPKLQGFAYGKLANIPILQLSNWNPILSMKTVIIELRKVIQNDCRIESTPLNDKNLSSSYSIIEQLLSKLETVAEIKSRIEIIKNKQSIMFNQSSFAVVNEVVDDICNNKDNKKIKLSLTNGDTESPITTEILTNTATSRTWAKGTGYGGGHYSKSNWDKDAYLAAQAEKYRLQEVILDQIITKLSESINCDHQSNQNVCLTLEESCMIPFLSSYLISLSLLEIQRHQGIYVKVFQVLEIFTVVTEFRRLLDRLDDDELSLQEYIARVKESIDMCLFKQTKSGGLADSSDNAETECIVYLSKVAGYVCSLSFERVTNVHKASINNDIISANESNQDNSTESDLEKQYISSMIPLQYCEIPSFTSYHYQNLIASASLTNVVKARIKRLAQEHADLSYDKASMLSWSSSVWIRANEERMDTLQVMISGPEGTPYCNGLFLFDVFFSNNYPQEPPKVNLKTTGRGTVRFNPNLYNCGKVCLSLLGTWSGDKMEVWNEDISTFRQVLISIQSLILVPEPYFNEPGYQNSIGTPEGTKASNSYNSNIYFQTHRWAMLDMLENPILGFEDVITTHFYYKRNEIKNNLSNLQRDNLISNGHDFNDMVKKLNVALDALDLTKK